MDKVTANRMITLTGFVRELTVDLGRNFHMLNLAIQAEHKELSLAFPDQGKDLAGVIPLHYDPQTLEDRKESALDKLLENDRRAAALDNNDLASLYYRFGLLRACLSHLSIIDSQYRFFYEIVDAKYYRRYSSYIAARLEDRESKTLRNAFKQMNISEDIIKSIF